MISWVMDKVCQETKRELEEKLQEAKAMTSFKFYVILPTMLILIVFLFVSLRDLLLTNRQLQKLNKNLKQLSHDTHQCKICFQSFNGSDHRPAKINCNHVYFCEPCLSTIAGNGTGRCPICEDRFSKKDITALYMSFV